MRVYNLTDVNRSAVAGGTQPLAIWRHRVAAPGGFAKAPGMAKLDPRLKDLARRGAIAFDEPPLEYLVAKGLRPAPTPEPVAKTPPAAPTPKPPGRAELITTLMNRHRKAQLVTLLLTAGIDHDPSSTKPVLAGIMVDAGLGGD